MSSMPELPEVETVKLFLSENIKDLKIHSIEIFNPKSFRGSPDEVEGRQVESVIRKGKLLIINLGNLNLMIHLKMSGQLIWCRKEEKFIGGHPTEDMFGLLPNKSTRVIFEFSDGSKLFFNDQRKFGWIRVISNDDLKLDSFLNKLGPEPLEEIFTYQLFKTNLLKRRKTPIKVALLDQEIVAGVGNIYACEACFLAGTDPRKKVTDLSDKGLQKLFQAVRETLNTGIKYGGSSKTHFVNPEEKKGLFLEYAYVYGRENLPCKKCGQPIKKIKLGGRGTYFCASCQVE